MFWILVVVIAVLAGLLAVSIGVTWLAMSKMQVTIENQSQVIADHCSQFAYQLCADDGDQVDLAKVLIGSDEQTPPKQRYFRVSREPRDYPMSGTESPIDFE